MSDGVVKVGQGFVLTVQVAPDATEIQEHSEAENDFDTAPKIHVLPNIIPTDVRNHYGQALDQQGHATNQ